MLWSLLRRQRVGMRRRILASSGLPGWRESLSRWEEAPAGMPRSFQTDFSIYVEINLEGDWRGVGWEGCVCERERTFWDICHEVPEHRVLFPTEACPNCLSTKGSVCPDGHNGPSRWVWVSVFLNDTSDSFLLWDSDKSCWCTICLDPGFFSF